MYAIPFYYFLGEPSRLILPRLATVGFSDGNTAGSSRYGPGTLWGEPYVHYMRPGLACQGPGLVQVHADKYLLNLAPNIYLPALDHNELLKRTSCTCRFGWYRMSRMNECRRPRGHLARLLGPVHAPIARVCCLEVGC